MLKRLFSVSFAVWMAFAVCFCASALDNKSTSVVSMTAPDDLTFVFTYPNEGSECIEAVFSVPDDLCAIASENMQDPYLDRVTAEQACLIQFDWSVDSRDAFHADETWDSAGGDYPIQQLNGNFLEKKEVFWFAYPQSAERCAGALKETTADGATVRTFDFGAHKLYVRARFMVYVYATGECTFSDWSDAYDVGADLGREAPTIPDVGEDRPAVTDAQSENSALRFVLHYPDSIRQTAYALLCGHGRTLSFESQIREDGGEWQYWLTENGDLPYLTGQRTVSLTDTENAKTVEYRCRLIGSDPTDGSAIITGWSDYVTVKDGHAEIVENDDPFGEKAEAKRLKDAEKEANKCKLCGICPIHPFGICMFIWLAVILLVMLTIVYNISASKKKKQRAAEIRAREEASRRAEPEKTGSFVQTDRIKLQTKDEPQEDKHDET